MKNLKPCLDMSGNKMRTQKLVDVTGSIINSRTKQKMTITMMNCRFRGFKFNLCSLTDMTDSGWKMSRDTTGIYRSKGSKIIYFNIPITAPEGRIWAVRMDRKSLDNEDSELSLASPIEMNTRRAH